MKNILLYIRASLTRSLVTAAIFAGVVANIHAQTAVPLFVKFNRTVNDTGATRNPDALVIAAPGEGWDFSAAAPVAGTTWNKVLRPTVTPATGTYTEAAPFVFNTLDNAALYGADGTLSSARLSAGLIGTHTRAEPGETRNTGLKDGQLLYDCWRVYAGTAYIRFKFTGLPANAHYILYCYSATGGAGQGGRYILHPSNFPSYKTSTFLYPDAAPEQTLPTSYIDLNGFTGTSTLFTVDTAGSRTVIPPATINTNSVAGSNTIWGAIHAVTTESGELTFRSGTNAQGARFFNGFQLIPYPAPTIIEQPESDMVGVLAQITELYAAARDVPYLNDADQNPLTYQWQISTDSGATWTDIPVQDPAGEGVHLGTSTIREPADVAVPATKIISVLTINNTQRSDAAWYRLKATNVAGGVSYSSHSALSVIDQPAPFLITEQPKDASIVVGDALTLRTAVSGTPPFTFKWQKSATADFATFTTVKTGVAGTATSDTLSFSPARRSDLGYYRAAITDVTRRNPIYSNVVYVYVEYAKPIITPPGRQTVVPGNVINLFGNVYTEIPITSFQWQISRDNGATWTDVVDGALYAGATTETLRIANADSSVAGLYRLVATNAMGTTTGGTIPLQVAAALVAHPVSVAADDAGHLFVTDDTSNTVHQLTLASGSAVKFAGQPGVAGHADGYYNQATFSAPLGAVAGPANTVFFADSLNATVRYVQADGAVGTIAGSTTVRNNVDGIGRAAAFNAPVGVSLDAAGNLYVADNAAHTIRRITPEAFDVTTLAGTAGTAGSANATSTNSGSNAAALFNAPGAIAVSPVNIAAATPWTVTAETPTTTSTTIYVADTGNNTIRRIALTWYLDRDPLTNIQSRTRISKNEITTIAGLAGVSGSTDGTGANARFNAPGGIAVDASGAIYVADTGNHTIRKIVYNEGVITVTTIGGLPGISGYQDGPTAATSLFNQPRALSVDVAGNVYVVDTANAAVRVIAPTGKVSTIVPTRGTDPIAGSSSSSSSGGGSSSGVTIAPAGSGDGGGDLGAGGGAPSTWFLGALAALGLLRTRKRFMKNRGIAGFGIVALLVGALVATPAARAQNPAVFVNLSTTQAATPGVAPTNAATFTIAAPGNGWNYGASAPFPGETWNNILSPHADDQVKPASKGYVQYDVVPLITANNIALSQPDGSASGVTLTASAVLNDANTATNTREVPRLVNPNGGTPAGLLNTAWRIYEGGNLLRFSFSGLPVDAHYLVYGYATTNGASQGAKFTLADANSLVAPAAWFDTSPVANTAPSLFVNTAGVLAPSAPAPLQVLSNAAGGANTNTTWSVLHAKVDSTGKIAVNVGRNANSSGYPNGFQLIPYPKAVITTNLPATTVATVNSSVTLTVVATGFDASDVLTYQWRKNGADLTGETNSTYTIASAQSTDDGSYDVVVTNYGGVTVSTATALTVSAGAVAPSITLQPVAQTATTGGTATFTTSANGTSPLTYTWQKSTAGTADADFSDLPGTDNVSLPLTSITTADAGYYRVRVTNGMLPDAVSNAVPLIVAPVVTASPVGAVVDVGSPASVNVVAATGPGSAPFAPTYEWKRNGTTVVDGSGISGATTATLSFSSFETTHSGNYTVTVTNAAGSVTTAPVYVGAPSTMTVTRWPAGGASEVNPDTPLKLTFSGGTPARGTIGRIRIHDAADDSVVRLIDVATLETFDSNKRPGYITTAVQGTTISYQPIAIYGNEVWINGPGGHGLQYGKTYYVTIEPGVILDQQGATYPGINDTTSWLFSTRATAPDISDRAISVAADGTGDFTSVQGALNQVPQNNTEATPYVISLAPGMYHESLVLGQSRKFVTVKGAGAAPADTVISHGWANATNGAVSAVFIIYVEDVRVENLTIENTAGETAGQQRAVTLGNKRAVFDRVLLKGWQDTLAVWNNAVAYFRDCEIWGSVDFIYGGGTALFDHCDIVEIRSGSQVAAPSTNIANPYGLVFRDCRLIKGRIATGHPYDVTAASCGLMRPWYPDGHTAFINCQLDDHISLKGWAEWDGRENTSRARELGSTLLATGAAITVVDRQAAGAYWLNTTDPDYTGTQSATDPLLTPPGGHLNRVAVPLSLADFTVDAIFGNTYLALGTWRPTVAPRIVSLPAPTTAAPGETAILSVNVFGLPEGTYQWYKGSTLIDGATSAQLTLTDVTLASAGTYHVVVTNALGSVTSGDVVLNIAEVAPTFTLQPAASQTVFLGQSVSFTATATGAPAPSYQWRKNGTPIDGATSSTYTISTAQAADAATYTVVATNNAGSSTSDPAVLNVTDPTGPAIVGDGFAQGVTGGAGGTTYVVTTATDLSAKLQLAEPAIITVVGTIDVRTLTSKRVDITSNKTLQGADANATIIGTVNIDGGVSNIIVRGLNITNPGTTLENGTGPRYTDGGDGLSIRNCTGVLVTHCTFYDCADGMCDLTYDVANATVSWCKFYYTPAQASHRFTMILGNEATTVAINATLHHNWWSSRCYERMPAAGFAKAHMYDNFFDCAGNEYSSNARGSTQFFSERNYYKQVKSPLYKQDAALIAANGNTYEGTTGIAADPGTDNVFTPSYSYQLDPVASVPTLVPAYAGNTAGFASTTPALTGPASLGILGAPSTLFVGQTVTLTPSVTGGTSFQWRFNNQDIPGATSESLALTNIQASQFGVYTLVVGDSSGGFTVSTPVALTAAAGPTFVGTTGGSATVVSGKQVVLRATVSGESVTLQWQRLVGGSWVDLADGAAYSGTRTGVLVVTAADAQAGDYRLVATNPAGTSASATYTIAVAPVVFPRPAGVAVDSFGTLYVADSSLNVVRKIAAGSSTAKLCAGLPNTAGYEDGAFGKSTLNSPGGLAIDAFGNLYVADAGNATVRTIARDGALTTLAGDPTKRGSRDGIGTAATFASPGGPSFDRTNGLTYVADINNHTIRRLTPYALQSGTFVGNTVATISGSAGQGGDADGYVVVGSTTPGSARFNHPAATAFYGTYVYVADTGNNTIRRISTSTITVDNVQRQFVTETLAGTPGVTGSDDGTGLAALFNQPQAIVADATGTTLYVADTGNHTIRSVTAEGVVTTLAGVPGISGLADGAGETALFNRPVALAFDAAGTTLYVADAGNATIRKLALSGSTVTVTTVAITGADDTVPTVTTPPPTFKPTVDSHGSSGGGSPSVWYLLAFVVSVCLRRLHPRTSRW